MRKHELYTEYHDYFEYFGNTEIERIRKQGEKTISEQSLLTPRLHKRHGKEGLMVFSFQTKEGVNHEESFSNYLYLQDT